MSTIHDFGLARYTTEAQKAIAESLKDNFTNSADGNEGLKQGVFLGADFIRTLFLELLEPDSREEIKQLLEWKKADGSTKQRYRYIWDGIRVCFAKSELFDHDNDSSTDQKRNIELVASQIRFKRDALGEVTQALEIEDKGVYYVSIPPIGAQPPVLNCPPAKIC